MMTTIGECWIGAANAIRTFSFREGSVFLASLIIRFRCADALYSQNQIF